jgi:hypothetical protein
MAVRTRAAIVSGFNWIRRSGEHAGGEHRPGRRVDVRAPARVADQRGGTVRPDLRVLGRPTALVIILLACCWWSLG